MLSDRVPSRQISHGLDEKAGLISLKVSDVLMLAGNVRSGPSRWPGRVHIIAGVRAARYGAASHTTGTRSQAYRGAGRIEASGCADPARAGSMRTGAPCGRVRTVGSWIGGRRQLDCRIAVDSRPQQSHPRRHPRLLPRRSPPQTYRLFATTQRLRGHGAPG